MGNKKKNSLYQGYVLPELEVVAPDLRGETDYGKFLLRNNPYNYEVNVLLQPGRTSTSFYPTTDFKTPKGGLNPLELKKVGGRRRYSDIRREYYDKRSGSIDDRDFETAMFALPFSAGISSGISNVGSNVLSSAVSEVNPVLGAAVGFIDPRNALKSVSKQASRAIGRGSRAYARTVVANRLPDKFNVGKKVEGSKVHDWLENKAMSSLDRRGDLGSQRIENLSEVLSRDKNKLLTLNNSTIDRLEEAAIRDFRHKLNQGIPYSVHHGSSTSILPFHGINGDIKVKFKGLSYNDEGNPIGLKTTASLIPDISHLPHKDTHLARAMGEELSIDNQVILTSTYDVRKTEEIRNNLLLPKRLRNEKNKGKNPLENILPSNTKEVVVPLGENKVITTYVDPVSKKVFPVVRDKNESTAFLDKISTPSYLEALEGIAVTGANSTKQYIPLNHPLRGDYIKLVQQANKHRRSGSYTYSPFLQDLLEDFKAHGVDPRATEITTPIVDKGNFYTDKFYEVTGLDKSKIPVTRAVVGTPKLYKSLDETGGIMSKFNDSEVGTSNLLVSDNDLLPIHEKNWEAIHSHTKDSYPHIRSISATGNGSVPDFASGRRNPYAFAPNNLGGHTIFAVTDPLQYGAGSSHTTNGLGLLKSNEEALRELGSKTSLDPTDAFLVKTTSNLKNQEGLRQFSEKWGDNMDKRWAVQHFNPITEISEKDKKFFEHLYGTDLQNKRVLAYTGVPYGSFDIIENKSWLKHDIPLNKESNALQAKINIFNSENHTGALPIREKVLLDNRSFDVSKPEYPKWTKEYITVQNKKSSGTTILTPDRRRIFPTSLHIPASSLAELYKAKKIINPGYGHMNNDPLLPRLIFKDGGRLR